MKFERRIVTTLVVFGLVAATTTQSALAEQSLTAEACTQLQDRSARLACFDQIFGPTPTQTEKALEPDDAVQGLSLEDLTIVDPAPDPVPEPEPEPSIPVVTTTTVTSASNTEGSGSLLNRRDKVNFKSRVRALRARDKQRMIFLLENGEVWMQSSPRNLAIKEGFDVTVKSGLFGGYMLRTSNGISTRVTRIK